MSVKQEEERRTNGQKLSTWVVTLWPIMVAATIAYGMVQVQAARIQIMEDAIIRHNALTGHAGISQRIDAIQREIDIHEKLDVERSEELKRRLSLLEDRWLEMDRREQKSKINLGGIAKEAQ